MNTIEELISGKLADATHIKLACGLTTFPEELFSLKETLEILDMTDNKLSSLPENFGAFKKLKILFLSNNYFTKLPTVLAKWNDPYFIDTNLVADTSCFFMSE